MKIFFKHIIYFALISFSSQFCFGLKTAPNIEGGFSAYHRDYKEDFVLPAKSQEAGMIYGGYLSYEYQHDDSFYFMVYDEYSTNTTPYNGSFQDDSGNYLGDAKGTTDSSFNDLWLKFGYTLPLQSNLSITPFAGFGGHVWDRSDIGCAGSSANQSRCYSETYSWATFLLGMKSDLWLTDNFRISPQIMFMFMESGSIQVEGTNFLTDTANLGNETQYYFDSKFSYFITHSIGFNFTPFFTIRPIGESDVQAQDANNGWKEPNSKTYTYGAHIGLSYNFGN